MSSRNLSTADRISLDGACEVLSNKETQTSSAYITDSFELIKGPSRPLPKGIDKADIEGTVNILDCRVIKDPTDSKTTAEFTESFIKDIENSNLSISDSVGSPSKYCKEVVKPYLKTNSNDCEDNVESLEKLIQNALEDIPDYQPCFEVYEGKKDIEEKTSRKEINKMDTNPQTHPTSKNSKERPPKKSFSTTNKTVKNLSDNHSKVTVPSDSMLKDAKKTVIRPDHPDDIKMPADDVETNTNKEIVKSLSRESITKCVKESLTALKKTASSCLEKIEIVIGIKKSENPNEKPTYYPMEKKKIQSSASQNVQTETGNSLNSIRNLFNNHQEKLTTIKDTVKDLSDKFYKTSKDAVTFITSESAKLLNKNKAEVHNADNVSENQSKKVKNLGNMSADSITSFLFKKAENKPIIDDAPQDEATVAQAKTTSSPLAVAPRMRKIADDLVTAKLDRSSPYDNPLPKEVSNKSPEQPESRMPTVSAIDHTPDPPSTSNMFTIIKSKIFSMFRDEIDKSTEPAIQESPPEDEEEDPFERFMEQ